MPPRGKEGHHSKESLMWCQKAEGVYRWVSPKECVLREGYGCADMCVCACALVCMCGYGIGVHLCNTYAFRASAGSSQDEAKPDG